MDPTWYLWDSCWALGTPPANAQLSPSESGRGLSWHPAPAAAHPGSLSPEDVSQFQHQALRPFCRGLWRVFGAAFGEALSAQRTAMAFTELPAVLCSPVLS